MNVSVPKPGPVTSALASKRPDLARVTAAIAALNAALKEAYDAGASVSVWVEVTQPTTDPEPRRFYSRVRLDPHGPVQIGELGFYRPHAEDEKGWIELEGEGVKVRIR